MRQSWKRILLSILGCGHLQADVNVKLVANLRNNVEAKVLPVTEASQHVSGNGVLIRSACACSLRIKKAASEGSAREVSI